MNGEGMTRLTACVSGQNKTDGNDDSTVCLKTETPDIKPRIVTYNGKHYIAIEITGASHDVILCGMWEGCLDKVITLINTDATTKPVGLQVVEFSDYFTVYGSESAKTLDTSLNVNGWTTDTDTAENWSSKKTCLWYFGVGGQLNGQPSQKGLLMNYVYGAQLHQVWHVQEDGFIYHRGGSTEKGLSDWVMMIDSDNIGESAKIKEIEARLTALEGGA